MISAEEDGLQPFGAVLINVIDILCHVWERDNGGAMEGPPTREECEAYWANVEDIRLSFWPLSDVTLDGRYPSSVIEGWHDGILRWEPPLYRGEERYDPTDGWDEYAGC